MREWVIRMKKVYEKPMLYVESFKLDASVAGSVTCTADNEVANQIKAAYEEYLKMLSLDHTESNFQAFWEKNKGSFAGGDTYCYHTAANSLFNS